MTDQANRSTAVAALIEKVKRLQAGIAELPHDPRCRSDNSILDPMECSVCALLDEYAITEIDMRAASPNLPWESAMAENRSTDPGRRITIILRHGHGEGMRGIHADLRTFFTARGAEVVATISGAVCAACKGDGKIAKRGQGCIVTEFVPCPACEGAGR